MRLGGEDNGRAPGTEAATNPAISLKDLEMGHDDLAFVRPIARLLATDGGRGTGVDGKFEIQDW
jgi:hypothetical protein